MTTRPGVPLLQEEHGEGNREPKNHGKPEDHGLACGSGLDLPWGGVTIWKAVLEVESVRQPLPREGPWNGVFLPAF